jgi:A/G-specific adenine glycosylase
MRQSNRIRSSRLNRGAILDNLRVWSRAHRRSFPWRARNLTNYQVLATEVMLIRTKAAQVESIWNPFFELFPTSKSIVQAPRSMLASAMRPLGLPWRCDLLIRLCSVLETEAVVQSTDRRQLFPAGNYAFDVLQVLRGWNGRMPIDHTIARLLNRLFGVGLVGDIRRSPEIRRCAERLEPVDAEDFWALLDLAALVCVPKDPLCFCCPLFNGCQSAKLPIGSNQSS